MARLDASRQRLETSIRRLEAAIEKRLAVSSPGEVEQLQRALGSAEAECTRLEAETETIAGRLDGTIDRLRRLLGE